MAALVRQTREQSPMCCFSMPGRMQPRWLEQGNIVVGRAEQPLPHIRVPGDGWIRYLAPLNSHNTYGMVVNRFLADGGDGYTAFNGLKGYDTGFVDTQAFLAYVSAKKPLDSLTQNLFFQTP